MLSINESTKERPTLIPFDKFSSFQKLLRTLEYPLLLITTHECYLNVDGRLIDLTGLEEAEQLFQYDVRGRFLIDL